MDAPPPYDLNTIKSSTVQLTANEITPSKEEPKVKNAVREGKLLTSDTGAFLHVVKSSLGSGLLAMPYAFSNIGLLGGIIATVFAALVCAHCLHIVVKCSQELCYLRGKTSMTYSETVQSAFMLGAGRRLAPWSSEMRNVAYFFMFITYYGVNTVYVILMATSFKQIVENYLDIDMNIRWYALMLTVVVLPVGIVRHLKFLVPFSAIANVFLLIGCSLTLYFCFIDLPPISSRPLIVEISRWPLFFSTAIFGMEGIGTVMPIENAVRKPANFLGCPSVLNLSMAVVAFLFLGMGSLGYLKFGNAVKGNITLNLPQDTLSEAVKILVALAVLFTYPLQLTASVEVAWDSCVSGWFSEKNQTSGYYLTRAILILGTVLIALAVPNLSPVLSLVGAIGFSGLGLLLPTVTEMVTYWDVLSKVTMVKHVFLFVLWAFTIVTGSITSVQEIVKEYKI